ncbi:MAG: response regulator [Bernardetiaceae bacterium]|nr:response regulator [Bernardetiaceae bacterium]
MKQIRLLLRRLSTKLIAGFSIVLVLSIAVNIFAIWKLQQVQQVAIEISENWMPSIYAISNINTNASEYMIRQQQHIFSLSEVEMADNERYMDAARARVDEQEAEYRKLLNERLKVYGNLESFEQNENWFETYKDLYNRYLSESKKIIQLSRYNNKEEAKDRMREQAFSTFEDFNQVLNQLIISNFDSGRSAAKESSKIFEDSRLLILLFTIVSIFLSISVAFLIVKDVRKQIGGEPADIADIARRVSDGDLAITFDRQEKEYSIYTSVRKMVENLRHVSNLTNNIARGDLSRRVDIKSQKDLLAISINQMIDNFKDIINQAKIIAKGDYSVNIKQRGEHDELGNALQLMTESLRRNKQETFEQNWIKDGINQLGQELSGNLMFAELSRKAINFIARYTDSAHGVIYIYDTENQILKLHASYAFVERNSLSNTYKIGEGLIGQVAIERSAILLKNIRRQDMTIETGTVNEPPLNSYAFPLMFENELYGVVEIASFELFNELKREFLEQASGTIATYIYSVQQTDRIKGLLAISEEATRSAEARAKEIEKANAQLEVQRQELQEKSGELRRRNESLIQAKEELDRRAEQLEISNRYKSEFLANMSHELRTPLNSIIMLSKMLAKNEQQKLAEKDVKKARIIYKSGEELLRLINDILDLSKIEAGKMIINPMDFTTHEILSDMHDLFHTLAQEKNLEFQFEDKVKGSLHTDKDRLAQVLRNFLSNAFKFTKKGFIKILVESEGENDEMVRFSIIDSGIGIPKDKQQVIFEAFKQADGTTSREYGGTGLGLSIARELTKLLQGSIEVDAEPGRGSNFSIALPKVIKEEELLASDEEDRVSIMVKNAKKQATSNLLKMREQAQKDTNEPAVEVEDDRLNIRQGDRTILIIEDEAQFAESLTEVLRTQNIKVIVARSGSQGIDYALKYLPNGIILDLGLPDIDGVDVLSKLKSIRELRHIPIEIVSARDRDISLLRKGARGFLQKPIDESALKSAMDDIMRLSSKSIKDLLIVEDDTSQMEAVKELLGGDDIRVKGVRTEAAAISELKKGVYDGAIVDLGLRQGDGYSICQFISENYPNIPVIIYTGKTLTLEEETKLRKAAQSIILKTQDADDKLKDEVAIFLHRMEQEVEKDRKPQIQEIKTEEQKEEQLRKLQVQYPVEKTTTTTNNTEKQQKVTNVAGKTQSKQTQQSKVQKQEQEMIRPGSWQKNKEILDAKGEIDKDKVSHWLKDKNILVVDDDIRNIFVIASALETFEANILEAMNGKEALEMIRDEEIDLVLMDAIMPEMNGLDAIRKIRETRDDKSLSVVAITGKAQEEDRQECLDAGANAYIVKPVDYEELIHVVCSWIRK